MPYTDLRKGRHSQAGQIYFVTATTAGRARWFERFELGRLVIREMQALQASRSIESIAFVVMPDHLHWLMTLGHAQTLSQVVNQLKGRSAHAVNHRLGRQGAVWQPGFHDHALRQEENVREVARYIVANPVRAGLVRRPGEYPHWDAVWL